MNENVIERFFEWLALTITIAAFGLLFALPIKWTWNVTMPYLFGLPTLTWGKAWCLYFLSNHLFKSIHTHQKSDGI